MSGPMAARPYLGPDSYGPEHRHLFFGRDPDGAALAAMVMSQRLSLLHAASGVGKTSLLGASLVPQLEDRGWLVVHCRPHNNPALTLETAALERVLPDPRLEVAAIDRFCQVLGRNGDGSECTLLEAKLRLENEVRKSSPEYIQVLSPLGHDDAAHAGATDEPTGARVYPFFVRFLQVPRGPWLLAKHMIAFDAFRAESRWADTTPVALANDLARMRLSELREFFSSPEVERIHGQALEFLTPRRDRDRDGRQESADSLHAFFARLIAFWGKRLEHFGLVLVLDQFEELFTRFVDQNNTPRETARRFSWDDPTSAPLGAESRTTETDGRPEDPRPPDASLKVEHFKGLGDLLRARFSPLEGQDEDPVLLPVRVLVSMRDDYIAKLDELEQSTGPIEKTARYHLRPLKIEAAHDVIRCPAELFDVHYEPEAFKQILAELPVEQDQIEPGHVQIVCGRLWESKAANRITQDQLRALGGVGGILDSHLTKFLDRYPEYDRLESLDMLEPLITSGRRRNIVELDVIVKAPYRKPGQRERLLEGLRRERIVRVESRLQVAFVEIMHEFLIEPVLREIRDRMPADSSWRVFKHAIGRLERFEQDGFRSQHELLSSSEIGQLLGYQACLDLERNPWIREVLYRSSILNEIGAGAVALQTHVSRLVELRKALEIDRRRANSQEDRLRDALASIDRLEEEGFRGRRHLLSTDELDALLASRKQLGLERNLVRPELMYRSAIMDGRPPQVLRRLREEVDRAGHAIDASRLKESLGARVRERRYMDIAEIQALLSAFDTTDLPKEQKEFLLHSTIRRGGGAAHQDAIGPLIRRLMG